MFTKLFSSLLPIVSLPLFSPNHSLLPSPAQPLLSPQELGNTKAIVNEFGREGGAGEKLQQVLLEKTNSNESWVCAGREGCGWEDREGDDG